MKFLFCNLLFILFFCGTIPLHARINETVAQCNERYGEPKKELKEGFFQKKYYFKNNINILIVFYGNRAVLISYAKPNINDSFYQSNEDFKKYGWVDTISSRNPLINLNLPFTEKEIDYFKSLNAQNEKWLPSGRNSWMREKNNVKATYFPNDRILSFEMIKFDFEELDSPYLKFNGL